MNDPVAFPEKATLHELPRHRAVTDLGRALEAADPGTIAAIRRASADSPPAAFYRITFSALDDLLRERGPARDEQERRWVVVLSAMAAAVGLLGGPPFGEALARADITEARVTRLLEAHDEQLASLVRHVVHQLVHNGQSFDPIDLADLVLGDGTSYAAYPRRRIARSFFGHIDVRRET